jgi:Tol biopolymer transport system component
MSEYRHTWIVHHTARLACIASAVAALFSAAVVIGRAPDLPRLSVEDIITMRRILSAQISPDERYVAYVVEQPEPGGPRGEQWSATLWVLGVDGGEPRQLNLDHHDVSSPQWSPDSSKLAFLASGEPDGRSQVFITGPDLTPPHQLTHHASSVSSYQWSPDSARIAFLAATTEAPPAEAQRRMKLGFDAMELEPHQTVQLHVPNRLTTVLVATGEETSVNTGPSHIMSARWSPDGRSFLLTAADKPYNDFEQLRPHLMTVASGGGEPAVYCATIGKLSGADWLSDGRSIVFLGSVRGDTDFYPGGLFVCDGQGSVPRNLTSGSNYSVESFREKDGKIIAFIAQNTQRFLGVMDPRGTGYSRLTPQDSTLQFRTDYSADRNSRRVVCVLGRWNEPPDIRLRRI